jgi:hypothetical protein
MRWQVLALAALVFSCGPDPEPHDCGGKPDFSVLVSAYSGPVPADTIIRLYYGGRPPDKPEELKLAEPTTPQALFCYPAARDGTYDDHGPAIGTQAQHGATAGASGAGGEGGAPNGVLEALVCNLYTDGSARLEVETLLYGKTELELKLKKDVCTVSTSLLLEPMDAGS